jgi:hypothetical protein
MTIVNSDEWYGHDRVPEMMQVHRKLHNNSVSNLRKKIDITWECENGIEIGWKSGNNMIDYKRRTINDNI